MKTKYLFMLPLFLNVFLMFSCSDQTKVYQNIDEWVADIAPHIESIDVQTLHAMLDTGAMVLLIDVREANEYNPGFIPGSVNIPRGIIEFNIAKDAYWEAQFLYPPLKEDEIILICKKGKRSLMTVDAVKKLGFDKVKYLEGGFKKWELTYPLEQEKNLEQVHKGDAEVGGC